MNGNVSEGFPGNILLLFTMLIWSLFLLVYFSNRQNRSNQWCAIAGLCFSMGVLKEYIYFTLDPVLISRFSFYNADLSYMLYSVLTGVLYYFALPCSIMFSFYFNGFHLRHPNIFSWLRYLIFVPGVLLSVIYPITNTRFFQLEDPAYYSIAACYNWIYGIIVTFFLLSSLTHEQNQRSRKQKKLVCIVTLPPLWYWLFSAFVVHLLNLRPFFKIWQGNIFIVFLLLIFCIINLFRDGILGTRLRRETYDWTIDDSIVQKNAQYISHALKNELLKIQWCTSMLREKFPSESPEELEILDRSASHLTHFVQKTKFYSNQISLDIQAVCLLDLLSEAAAGIPDDMKGKAEIILECPDDIILFCDKTHVLEVFNNLIGNAFESFSSNGILKITCRRKYRFIVIHLQDNGCGITKEELPYLFEPYRTTKISNHHLGLGLYYCNKVMKEHRGIIKVNSTPGKGSVFSLYFPVRPRKLKK